MNRIQFTVYGKAEPQGNKRAFAHKHTGKIVMVEGSASGKLRPWRQQVSGTAMAAMSEAGLSPWSRETALQANLRFYFRRPQHLPKRVTEKTTKPDLDKLIRAVWDALTGIVFADDSQICREASRKDFGEPERVEIEIAEAVQ